MYEESDAIRDKLAAKGIELKDEIQKTIWLKEEKKFKKMNNYFFFAAVTREITSLSLS